MAPPSSAVTGIAEQELVDPRCMAVDAVQDPGVRLSSARSVPAPSGSPSAAAAQAPEAGAGIPSLSVPVVPAEIVASAGLGTPSTTAAAATTMYPATPTSTAAVVAEALESSAGMPISLPPESRLPASSEWAQQLERDLLAAMTALFCSTG